MTLRCLRVRVSRLPPWTQAADALVIALLVFAVGLALYGGRVDPPGQLAGFGSVGLAAGFLGGRAVRGPRTISSAISPFTERIGRRLGRSFSALSHGTRTSCLAAGRRESAAGVGRAVLPGRRGRPSVRSADGRDDLSSGPRAGQRASASTSAIHSCRRGVSRGSPISSRGIRSTSSTPTSFIPSLERWPIRTRCWCRR